MQDAPDSPLKRAIDHITAARFTGRLRVRSREAEGELWFMAGILEQSRFGVSKGDEAVSRMLKASESTYEAEPLLPSLTGDFKQRVPLTGSFAQFPPVTLMRYCERCALTCTLKLSGKERSVRLVYQTGELMSVEASTGGNEVLAGMLESQEGNYEFSLPVFELPTGVPRASTPAPGSLSLAERVDLRLREETGADAAAQRKAAEEAKLSAEREAEARRRAEQEAAAKREAEARQKAEQEAAAKREAEARRKAEEEAAAKLKAEREAAAKREAEARRKAEQEAAAKREAEARRKAEQEAAAKREAEARRKAEQEAAAKREAEARQKAEEAAAKAKAEREAEERRQAEAEAAAKREAEREAEARRKAEEEAAAKLEAERAAAAREKAEHEAAEAKRIAEAQAKAAREREADTRRERVREPKRAEKPVAELPADEAEEDRLAELAQQKRRPVGIWIVLVLMLAAVAYVLLAKR